MILLVFLAICAATVPLTGGRLGALGDLRLRHRWALGVGLALQVIILTIVPGPPDGTRVIMLLVSYLFGIGFLIANRRVPGFWLIGIGAAMNLAAIAANGGVMPASPDALATAGLLQHQAVFRNSMAVPGAHLLFLGDIFAIPETWPLSNVFSPGDVAMVLGAALAMHRIGHSRLLPPVGGRFAVLFRQPDFVRLWSAQAVSNLGDWTYGVAVAVLLVRRTHDPRALALLLVAQVGPAALLGTILGPLADRHSRTLLMVGADIARGVAIASLLVVGTPSIGHIYAVAVCLGIFSVIFQPSLQAALPTVVREEELVTANALVSATFYFAVTAGPALGGFLAAALGGKPVFAINALSFLVSAALIAGVRLPPPRRQHVLSTVRRDLVDGARYVARTPLVRGLLVVIGIVLVAAASKAPLESLFVLETLSYGPQALGLVAASWGFGMLIGSVAAPAMTRRWHRERLLWLNIGVVGLAVLSASRATELSSVLLAWLIAGAANALGNVCYETLLQERTPDPVRGRVFAAFETVTNAAFLVGAFAAAWLGSQLGVRAAYAVSGTVLVAAALLSRVLVTSDGAAPRTDATLSSEVPRPDAQTID